MRLADEFEQRIGIFARTFPRSTPGEVAAAVSGAGYALAHWNFAATGRATLAGDVDDAAFDDVRQAFDALRIGIPSLSATFNVIHPDVGQRARQTAEAVRLIGLAPRLGAHVVTLCTGTRNTENMWQAHPANVDPDAWRDLRQTLDPLLQAADTAGVQLGIEPEPGNVIRDAEAAAKLLAELGKGAPIGIVLDPANLLTPETVARQDEIVGHAIDLLGLRVLGAQAKDVVRSGYAAAGAGLLDYPAVLRQLARLGPIPLIVQDADEDDACTSSDRPAPLAERMISSPRWPRRRSARRWRCRRAG